MVLLCVMSWPPPESDYVWYSVADTVMHVRVTSYAVVSRCVRHVRVVSCRQRS